MFCCNLLYVHSSIAIILMGKRELFALLNLSSWCLEVVEQLFLAVPWGCLQFLIVVFPDHTHLLFVLRICSNYMTSCKHSAITFCQTNFVRWVFATRSEYIANTYCKQSSSQNIRSIFIRYLHKDSFSVRGS